VRQDAALGEIASARFAELDRAVENRGTDIGCNTAAFHWSDAQIEQSARTLASLYRSSPAVGIAAQGPLRASGMYVRYQDSAGAEMLERAWMDCLRGINRAIDAYALGMAPRYPAIDSLTLRSKDGCLSSPGAARRRCPPGRPERDLAWSTPGGDVA
jgi:hypothetical protein